MRLLDQLFAQSAAVDTTAVRDTIAAIASQPAYRRSPTDTLADQLWRALVDAFDRLTQTITGSVTSRRITLIVIGSMLLMVIVRAFINDRATRSLTRRRAPHARQMYGDAWAEAQRLAAAGQYTDAAHALCAAVLQACAARGEVRLHPSKTTGDYARELRRRGATAHTPFQGFRKRYDRLVYGELQCSATDYAALLSDATPIMGAQRQAEGRQAA